MAFTFASNAPEGTIVEVTPGRKMIKEDGRWKLYFNNNATAAGYVADAELAATQAEVDQVELSVEQLRDELIQLEAELLAALSDKLSKLAGGTIEGAVAFQSTQTSGMVEMGPSETEFDLSLATYFTKTVNSAQAFTFVNPPALGQVYAFTMRILLSSGSFSFPSSVKFPNDTALSLTAGKYHLLTFVTDNAGASWRGSVNSNYSA